MLKQSSLEILKNKKNLLAFSAGGDSTALFFLLRENNIDFDIAIVDYHQRLQSKEEVAYAQELASKFNCKIYTLNAPEIQKNFEAMAREIRYDFFEQIIAKEKYDNLLTAHHLGDRFEWMLMQFCKGAGCIELAGMQEIQQRDNYTLVRPLLHVDKTELLQFLQKKNLKYFEDASNLDENITRNSFRHKHTTPLLQEYRNGIAKSFEYIDKDVKSLYHEIKVESIENLAYFKTSPSVRSNVLAIDKYLKQNSYMLSADEKELLEKEISVVVGRKFLVSKINNYIFISPYFVDKEAMNKEFKEECRILKVDPKLRVFLYKNQQIFLHVKELLNTL